MVLSSVHVHPRGLNVVMQTKVYALRKHGLKGKKMSWEKIAAKIRNKQGLAPGWKVCRDAFNRMCTRTGTAKYKYANCGRKATLTKPLRVWLVRRLRVLRRSTECTSTTLQRELAREKHVTVEASTVRRALHLEGYRWLARSKKPMYNERDRALRVGFAREVMTLSEEELRAKMNFSMDGVVFTIPPQDVVARENYCRSDVTRVWRLRGEGSLTELHGHDRYKNQVPPSRMIPLWGGLAYGGFAPVLWHDERKTDAVDWSKAVRDGALVAALRAVNHPSKARGPWTILCDNESFLRAPECLALYRRLDISLWKLPPRSPDLNPIEKMWGWARRRLRAMDLADLIARRAVLGRVAYKSRVRRLLRTQRAQQVAAAFASNLRTVAARVIKQKGAAVRG